MQSLSAINESIFYYRQIALTVYFNIPTQKQGGAFPQHCPAFSAPQISAIGRS
jgi:hypothetical protein